MCPMCLSLYPFWYKLFCPPQDFFQYASGPGVDGTLRKRAEKFKAHLTKKFCWDFDADLDDCAPVVVELPEGFSVDWVSNLWEGIQIAGSRVEPLLPGEVEFLPPSLFLVRWLPLVAGLKIGLFDRLPGTLSTLSKKFNTFFFFFFK